MKERWEGDITQQWQKIGKTTFGIFIMMPRYLKRMIWQIRYLINYYFNYKLIYYILLVNY